MAPTFEQLNQCMCECMARMVTVHDTKDDLAAKAEVAVEAAHALAKASKQKIERSPMRPRKRP